MADPIDIERKKPILKASRIKDTSNQTKGSDMKIIGVNGSPRKQWNTATLLEKALAGAASQGAETELVHLYDLDFKGCTSCFACKLIGGSFEGRCAMRDELTPLIERITRKTDALILGTPIYFGGMTGEARSFMERLLFAPLVYSTPPRTVFPIKVKTGLIYTMNVTAESSMERQYPVLYQTAESYFSRILGAPAETLCVYDTCQFPDYSRVVMEYMDPAHKIEQREKAFPQDCQRAYELGVRLVTPD